jgi:hypothetical protein
VSAARTPAERAARLLRWYPRAWRDRYGEEFTGLPPRLPAFKVGLAAAACAVMAVVFGGGCHTGSFFNAQEPPSLAFLARQLTKP